MAMLNIPSYRDDPNYRYKMPKLLSKIEGRGNGIKTNIMNMADIAKALKRPPEYPTKFCGHELGAPAKFDTAEGKAIVNGAHETRDLQQLIDKFVEKYVLCPSCQLPEIDLILKKSTVSCSCNACGYSGELDNSHKLATFIAKNPPAGGESTMGGKKVSKQERRAEKQARGGDTSDPTVEKSSKKKIKSEKKEKSGEKAEGGEKKEKKKKSSKKKTAVVGSGEDASGSDKKVKSSKKSKTAAVNQNLLQKDLLTYESAEIEDVIDRLRAFLEEGDKTPKSEDFFREMRVLQVSQDFDAVMRFFVALSVFFGREKITADGVEAKMSYLRVMVDSSMSTAKVCTALEDFMFLKAPEKIKDEYPHILHKLYTFDCLEEKHLLSHYQRKMSEEELSGSEKTKPFVAAKEAAAPFLDWLAEGSSSEDSSDDDEENEGLPPLPLGPSIKSLGSNPPVCVGRSSQASSPVHLSASAVTSPTNNNKSMQDDKLVDSSDDDFDIEDI